MTQFIQGPNRTWDAGASIAKFRCVRLSSTEDNTVHINSSSTVVSVGASQHSASDGEAVTVQLGGTAKLECVAAITKGARVKASTSGKIRTSTTANEAVVGTALETGAASRIIEVDLSARASNF